MDASVIQEAISWLRSRECLNLFYRAMKKDGRYTTFSEALEDGRGRTICDTFTWSETPEGRDYWSELDDDFYCWWLG